MESGTISILMGEFILGITKGVVFWVLVLAITWLIVQLKHWHRRRKVDRRIIRQAKAIGAWDKRPTTLGGRALELKAWEDFKIKRKPEETDAQLRRRCMAAADKKYANKTRQGGSNDGRL